MTHDMCTSCQLCMVPTRGVQRVLPCTDRRRDSLPKGFLNLYRLLRENTPERQWHMAAGRPEVEVRLAPQRAHNTPKLKEPRPDFMREAKRAIGNQNVLLALEPIDCRLYLSKEKRDHFILRHIKEEYPVSERAKRYLDYRHIRRRMIQRHKYMDKDEE